MRLVDFPRFVPPEAYERSLQRMVERLRRAPGILSLYQLGSMSAPGISDIDLIAVFEDGTEWLEDPRKGLSDEEHYLFPHGLFGASRAHFQEARKHCCLYGYRHLWGEEFDVVSRLEDGEWHSSLKEQFALEYLLRVFMSMTVERAYGTGRVRGFLLQSRAVRFDLELLEEKCDTLLMHLEEVETWRKSWFGRTPTGSEVATGMEGFLRGLESFLRSRFEQGKFFLPGGSPLRIGPHLTILPDGPFRTEHRGVAFPVLATVLGRRAFNLQHRWNRFVFHVPSEEAPAGPLRAKAEYDAAVQEHNARNLPNFIPLKSPLPCGRRP